MKIVDLKAKLNRLIVESGVEKDGIDYLVCYYIHRLGWSQKQALEYTIKLFENGTMAQIYELGKDGD